MERAEFGELGTASRPEAADVEHQPGARASLPVHGEPGQLLKRLENLAVVTDQLIERGADHGDDRTVALHVHVDVAVEIGDVE